jgi:ornithine decarboxylase
MEPPPLADYIAAIEAGAAALPAGVRLWAEPGRALVAGGGSVVVQVQLRRGDTL